MLSLSEVDLKHNQLELKIALSTGCVISSLLLLKSNSNEELQKGLGHLVNHSFTSY